MQTITNNELIINHLPLANKLVFQNSGYLKDYNEIEELKSIAYLSLVEAAQKYDKNRSSFITYAYYKITFSIKDYFRNMNKLSKIKFFELENDL
jgi:RNA polymerase sigma factor (sigma-70 family)